MAVELTILVGTMTGTAELCAEEIQEQFTDLGHEVDILLMDNQNAAVFNPARNYLICTSTYGQGDVPDNAVALYESLKKVRPDLSGMKYGVVALGDRTYGETFTQGGLRFDEILTELKAERVGDVFRHDASSGTIPEEEATEWALAWIKLFGNGHERAA